MDPLEVAAAAPGRLGLGVDLLDGLAVLGELGDSREHALVMKSTVPVGTGRSIQRRRPGTGGELVAGLGG